MMMFSKEEYQECLETLLRFAHESPNVKWALIHERIRLENLIETYPEYLELKEKATPKKPTKSVCPNCDSWDIYSEEFDNKYNFCPNCGQAIDWSEND